MKNKTIIVAGLIFSLLLPIYVTFAGNCMSPNPSDHIDCYKLTQEQIDKIKQQDKETIELVIIDYRQGKIQIDDPEVLKIMEDRNKGGASIIHQSTAAPVAAPTPAVKNTTTTNSFSLDPMCQKTYGENSFYAGESAGNTASGCACKNGYSWNNKANRTACVIQSNDEICADTLGNNWKWDGTKNDKGSLNCGCKKGFAQNNGDCVIPPMEEKAIIPVVEKAPVPKKETVTPKAPIPRIEYKSPTPSVKKETKKPNVIKVKQKETVIPQSNPESVKKVKWYQKIFSWFW